MAIRLRRFVPFSPEDFLAENSEWFPWVRLILYCALFITLVMAFFPKSLKDHNDRKRISIVLGLILGIGLFTAEKVLKFSFASFAFMSIWMIIFLVGLVAFGIFRSGMKNPFDAFALTYVLMYLSFVTVQDTLFDAIAGSITWINGVLFVCFLYLLVRVIIKIFSRKKTTERAAFEFRHDNIPPADQAEIERELELDKEEKKNLKKRTNKLTNIELDKIEDIEKSVNQLILTLKKNPSITEEERKDIYELLNRIAAKKKDFEYGLQILDRHIEKYERGDEQQIHEISVRLAEAKDKKKKAEIKKELDFEKRKIEIFEFMKRDKVRLSGFLSFFEKEMYNAVEYLKQSNVPESINRLSMVKQQLGTMRDVLKDLTGFVSYLIKYSKKEEKILKKEEQGR